MTCDTAKLLVHFGRADLSAEDAAALADHLKTCHGCSAFAKSHRAEDAAISSAMKAVPIPIGFHDALQTQAISTRNAIWRATWLKRTAAVAAAVLFLFAGYGIISNLTKPEIDSERLLSDFESGPQGSSIQSFDSWRAAEGVPQLPDDFNLNLMTFSGRLALNKVSVPAIRLQAGPGQEAIIYFCRNSKFDLSKAGDAIGSQGCVRVYRRDGWTIVVVHTGSSLAPFLNRPGSSA